MEPKYHTLFQAVIITLALMALSHPQPMERTASTSTVDDLWHASHEEHLPEAWAHTP